MLSCRHRKRCALKSCCASTINLIEINHQFSSRKNSTAFAVVALAASSSPTPWHSATVRRMAGRFEGSLRPLPPVGIINGASVSIMSWERGTIGTSLRSALPRFSSQMHPVNPICQIQNHVRTAVGGSVLRNSRAAAHAVSNVTGKQGSARKMGYSSRKL